MTEFNSCPAAGLPRETKESLSGVSRRNFLRTIAVAAGSIGLSSIATSALASHKKFKICATKDIKVGGASSFRVAGAKNLMVLITQPKPGVFRAFDQRCPHNGLAINSIKGKNLACQAQGKGHGSQFDMTSGSPKTGPAKKSLRRFEVTVEKKFIYLSIDD
jgi:nitrite reductase/ring-hydroxylating ferredoxin subunit